MFLGKLDKSNDPVIKKAYTAWCRQRSRCYNQNDKKYQYYGARGVLVQYSSRAFVAWYLEEFKKFKFSDLPNLSVGRIDHSSNYSFNNIRLEPISDNSKERIQRLKSPAYSRSIPVVCYTRDTLEPLMVFRDSSQAMRFTGVHKHSIRLCCKGEPRSINSGSTLGLTFSFLGNKPPKLPKRRVKQKRQVYFYMQGVLKLKFDSLKQAKVVTGFKSLDYHFRDKLVATVHGYTVKLGNEQTAGGDIQVQGHDSASSFAQQPLV